MDSLSPSLLAPENRPARGTADELAPRRRPRGRVRAVLTGIDLCARADGLVRAALALAPVGQPSVDPPRAIEAAPDGVVGSVPSRLPPSLGLRTVNALAAAGFVPSPVVPAYLSLLSVRQMLLREAVEAYFPAKKA